MEVLLSFTGFHDPFKDTAVDGDQQAGPLLTVLSSRHFDTVCLFSTPRLAERTTETQSAITQRHPDVEVRILDVPLSDPTNYMGILEQLRKHFSKLSRELPEARFSISVSSGTPHMHASWILLAASGEIPAKILQSIPPEFVRPGKERVKEIDILQPGFPHVVRPVSIPQAVENDDTNLQAACIETGIVGNDPAFMDALREAAIYSEYDVHVLLLGETGSGKEFFARLLHQMGKRSGKPMVTVNCSSIPENLVESYLFGHRKGSFTGATSDQLGKFKAADGGVIFLDELGELPLSAQAKLLRTLEDGEIEPIGAVHTTKVNVVVIAATNRNLKEMVQQGTFREDLLQRFGSQVQIPPLRQRRNDIPTLAIHLLDLWNRQFKNQRRLTADALSRLKGLDWPGNVRELRNVIHQSAMLTRKQVIGPEDLKLQRSAEESDLIGLPEPEEGFELSAFLDETKDRLIRRALEKSDHVQSRAAKLLGWTPQAVSQHLKSREAKRL